MGTLKELGDRVGSLETRMMQVRQECETAGLYARVADRKVTEFEQTAKAHTRLLVALREDQLDQRNELRKLRREVSRIRGEMKKGFIKLDSEFGEFRKELEVLSSRINELG
jgi:hypothetical protein